MPGGWGSRRRRRREGLPQKLCWDAWPLAGPPWLTSAVTCCFWGRTKLSSEQSGPFLARAAGADELQRKDFLKPQKVAGAALGAFPSSDSL